MNTNPNAIKILCYGDSNTWGYQAPEGDRYPADIRWTGLLQKSLGNSYEIIQEGLNSRTTTADDPLYAGKNGKTYLLPCLETHEPFDVIILWLGTNDLKQRIGRIPHEIANGIQELIAVINELETKVKIILVCPPLVNEAVPAAQKNYKGAQEKSVQLPALYQAIAKKHALPFVNLQELIEPSPQDGIHLEPEAHAAIAAAFAQLILGLIKD